MSEIAEPAAVLWDMDGTLVDTEPYWIAEQSALMNSQGLEWTHDQAMELVGNALTDSAAIMMSYGAAGTADEIVDILLRGVIRRVRGNVPFRPGARELLAELGAAGIPCALVTMSYRSLAQAVVDELPEGSFAAIVGGDDVRHGKPHPEPYERGAAALGHQPRECIALEDSPPGLASAASAGTVAVGIRHLLPLQTPGRGIVIDTLDGVTVRTLTEIYASFAP